jgi:hypothetical protein
MSHLLLLLTDYDHGGSLESFCWFYLLFHSGVIYGLVGCDILVKNFAEIHNQAVSLFTTVKVSNYIIYKFNKLCITGKAFRNPDICVANSFKTLWVMLSGPGVI